MEKLSLVHSEYLLHHAVVYVAEPGTEPQSAYSKSNFTFFFMNNNISSLTDSLKFFSGGFTAQAVACKEISFCP